MLNTTFDSPLISNFDLRKLGYRLSFVLVTRSLKTCGAYGTRKFATDQSNIYKKETATPNDFEVLS